MQTKKKHSDTHSENRLIPSVSELLDRNVAQILRRRPSESQTIARPKLKGNIVPPFIGQSENGKGHSLFTDIGPSGRENLENKMPSGECKDLKFQILPGTIVYGCLLPADVTNKFAFSVKRGKRSDPHLNLRRNRKSRAKAFTTGN